MPINPTTLKALIDTQITNETVDFAITPAEVGGRMKDTIDYTTENAIFKVQKTTITSAQILDLFTTPITVLDSSTAGIVNVPISIYIKRTAGTSYTFSSAFLFLVNDFNTNVATLAATLLTNATNGFTQAVVGVTQTSSADIKSNFYKLKASTANPTNGTGDIDVFVTYAQITL
jgi:hypothetical protein